MKNLENIHNIADSSTDDIADSPATDIAPVTEPTPPPVEESIPSPPHIDEQTALLIAEAEQRGYIRGRNEAIDALLIDEPLDGYDDSCPSFLADIRPGFWD